MKLHEITMILPSLLGGSPMSVGETDPLHDKSTAIFVCVSQSLMSETAAQQDLSLAFEIEIPGSPYLMNSRRLKTTS